MPYDDKGNLIIDYGNLIASTDRNIIIQKIQKGDEEALQPVVVMPLFYWKKIVRYGVETTPVN